MLLVLAGSAWLIWSSVNRLTLANRQLRQKTSTVSALADEVQRLEARHNRRTSNRSTRAFEEAKKLLFSGPAEYAVWKKSCAIRPPLCSWIPHFCKAPPGPRQISRTKSWSCPQRLTSILRRRVLEELLV
jgi:hypothetical protein